jgi:hypothetical protein
VEWPQPPDTLVVRAKGPHKHEKDDKQRLFCEFGVKELYRLFSVCPLAGSHQPLDKSTWSTVLFEFGLPTFSSDTFAILSNAEIASCSRLKICAGPIASVR